MDAHWMTERDFHRRVTRFTAAFSLTTLVLIGGYLFALLQLSAAEWAGYFQIIGGLFPVMFVGVAIVNTPHPPDREGSQRTDRGFHLRCRVDGERQGPSRGDPPGQQGPGPRQRHHSTFRRFNERTRRTAPVYNSEQAKGSARIRENIEGVRIAIETINNSLQRQSSGCRDVGAFLEEVAGRSSHNDELSQRLDRVSQELLEQASELRRDVDHFQL